MNSGFECRDWQVAHPFLATENGCPTLSPVSSRKGWETPAPTRPQPGTHPSRFRAFFQARTGRRQLAPPQVAEGSWPHRRWCLQRITLPARTMKTCGSIPVPGRETESTQRGTPPPWGGAFPFSSLFWRNSWAYLSSFLRFANLQASRTLDRAHLEPFHKPNGINAKVGACAAHYRTLLLNSGLSS
jgi:hypothetical protein